MQGKGFIVTIAIVLGLICFNELLPTYYASKVEKEAKAIAGEDPIKYQKEIQRLSKDSINLGFTQLDYLKAKENEMKLGLDLKGGINVLLEINQRDLVNELTNYSTNPILIEALNKTDLSQRSSTKSYIEDFFIQFDLVNKEKGNNLKLASPEVFGTQKLSSEIKFNTSNEDVKKIITRKIDANVETAYQVMRTRIDKIGVTQPVVQRVPGTGRIYVEMPGIKDIERVKKILQSSAKLQFWEVQTLPEIAPYFEQLARVISVKGDSIGISKNTDITKLLQINTLRQNGVGNIKLSDTATINKLLNNQAAIDARPANLKYTKFMWAYKPESNDVNNLVLYAIKGTANNKSPVGGSVDRAQVSFGDFGKVVVDMQMDSEGTKDWKVLTEKNVGRPLAVTLDDRVYTAPNVNEPIPSGRSQISGSFTQEEAKDLVDVLSAGKLPAGTKIVQADVIGPSLGEKSINDGVISFGVAFLVIVIYMIFYYGGAGIYAVIAMIINLFYIFGIVDSIDATLTLPGIAGIVLTMAMAVDTNVIIYERTKEELFAGKSIKEAYKDGFKHALSAIIDGHLTTLLTAIVLYIFGTGPIQGFAVTLIIGILMTLFTSVLLSRVMIFSRLNKGKSISVWTAPTKNLFRNVKLNFINKRKIAYAFSLVVMVISIYSIATNGFRFGIDFKGGRNYIVKFEKPVDALKIEAELEKQFKDKNGELISIEAKTYGNDSQLKITTDYKINDDSDTADAEIEKKLFEGLKNELPKTSTFQTFVSTEKDPIGIISSAKVGPTVADDIKTGGALAVIAALAAIFIYILVRFKQWQLSLGAVVGLFHDAIIILGAFSLFYKISPFNMEINQDFVAAILTVLGYSINDTVIVFDRIREYRREKKSMSLAQLFDDSISSTLGRTFNTSFVTILVVLSIFIFGGENLRGFMFALLLGITFGTYSSIFVSSAIAFDCFKKKKEGKLKTT